MKKSLISKWSRIISIFLSPLMILSLLGPGTVRATAVSWSETSIEYQTDTNSDNLTSPHTTPIAEDLTATVVEGTRVELQWSCNITDTQGFVIERATNEAFSENVTRIAIAPELHDFTDDSVTPGNTYYFRVFVITTAGLSTPSNVISVTLPPESNSDTEYIIPIPENLLALVNSGGQVLLNWTCNTTDIDGFVIERALNVDFTEELVSIAAGSDLAAYTDNTVLAGLTYFYRVCSRLQEQRSDYSEVVSVSIPVEVKEDTSDAFTANILATPDRETVLYSSDNRVSLRVPAGAVDMPTQIRLKAIPPFSSSGKKVFSVFELEAWPEGEDSKNSIKTFGKELEITIKHSADELSGINAESLHLYYLDEKTLTWTPLTDSKFDSRSNLITAKTNHFTHFGEFADYLEVGPGRVMSHSVDLQTGASSYNYPIEIPSGPGGFQPMVSLNYNSNSVNEMKNKQSVGSWVGIGWTLSLGKISRDLTTGIYYLDLSGASYQLATIDDIHFKTNPDQYFTITRSANNWDVYDSSGNYYLFGGTDNADSVQYFYDTSTSSTKYYRWDLSLFRDTNDNEASISYIRDLIDGNTVRSAYPEYLTYCNDAAQIHFISSFGDPPTPAPPAGDGNLRKDNPMTCGSNPAPKIIENKKLDAIEVKFNNVLVRKYYFAYNTTNPVPDDDYGGIYYAGTHTLSSIIQKDEDDDESLPATSFYYGDPKQIYRHTDEGDYYGNPGNAASLSWPFLTAVRSGYSGNNDTVTFTYTQKPNAGTSDIWTREVVTAKTINSGIGATQSYTYAYATGADANPQYLRRDWGQQYRGFGEVTETDDAGNYVKHFFYTTGVVNGKDAEKLTGKEYKTQWYDAADALLEEKNYDWNWVNTSESYDVLSLWGYTGGSNWLIYSPKGVAVTGDGYVFISDQYQNKVQKSDEHGNPILKWGSAGTSDNQFNVPMGLGLGTDGSVYVADYGNNRIQKFSATGTLLGWFGKGNQTTGWHNPGSGQYGVAGSGNGEFAYPTEATPDSSYIYVADRANNRIQKFTTGGSYDSQWGSAGSGAGQFNWPVAVALDSSGLLYVAEYGNCRIQEFTTAGGYVSMWGSMGSSDGQFMAPNGISITGESVFVADFGNYRIQQSNLSGTFVRKWATYENVSPWDVAVSNNSMYIVIPGSGSPILEYIKNWTIRLDQIDDTTDSKTTRTRFFYDSYGNVVTQYQDGDTDDTDDDSTIWRSFYPNTADNILGKVARERVYDGINTTDNGTGLCKETLYYYDDSQSCTTPPEAGNLTRLEQKKDANNSIDTYYAYDGWGNKVSETDPEGNQTLWGYDETYHTYTTNMTYPAVAGGTFIEYYEYDPITGNLLSSTDINGQETAYEYDSFQRLITIDKPLGRDPDINYDYSEWGTLGEQCITTNVYSADDNFTWEKQYFDGLGRVVQVQSSGPDANHTIIGKTTVYNSRGLVDKEYVSQNISSPLSAYYNTGIANWKYTSFVYDGLGRVVTQINADNTTIQNTYDAWQTKVENENHHYKRYYYDAFQRLIKVEELEDDEDVYATTEYAYDVQGNLLTVTDNATNQTEMIYNWLSQKTNMDDPDMGQWQYEYDNNGNLTTQTDAMGQTITFMYDAMNRLTGKTYEQGSGMADVVYSYDNVSGGNYGKGKRTGMTDAAGATLYTYDQRRRLIEESRTLDGATYITSYTYDGADRLATVTYPDAGSGRETVTQQYDERGFPVSLSSSLNDSIVEEAVYNQLGQLVQIDLGNGLKTTYSYWGLDHEESFYGKLWRIQTMPQAGGTVIQDIKYTWDDGGNLTQRESLTNVTPSSDTTPPAAVTTLLADNATIDSIRLVWAAPGDDGATGTAAQYDIRYSMSAIDENNWASATQVSNEPTPIAAGYTQSYIVTGLNPNTTYYFALKTNDEVPNWSGISNSTEMVTLSTGPVVIITINDGSGASDTTAPGAISNLSGGSATSNSITLAWTSPGDDNVTGIATQYDIRYSTATITEGNWASATQLTGEVPPQVAGTNQSFVVSGLSANTTYYFALKTADEVPNWSGISNCASATTSILGPIVIININSSPDTTAPATISDLIVYAPWADSLRLTWTTPGNDDNAGTSAQYDIRYSTSAINAGNWASATQVSGEPVPLIAGTEQSFTVSGLTVDVTYYFAIKTADEVANWSGVSNSPSGTTSASSETEIEYFGYDILDRLTSVSEAYSENYTYDAIGNLSSHNGVNYTYGDNDHKHAVTAIGGTNYAYDDNGNMTTRGSQTITWDAENRPTAITGGVSFAYDGDGIRAKKTESGQTILYVNEYFEKNLTTGEVTTYYYFGENMVAKRTGTTLEYTHQDSLNSVSVVSNSDGSYVGSVDYYPLGGARQTQGTLNTDKLFTGQRLDGSGLYYYGARYYDPNIGRFVSPDTIVPNAMNPQAYNRYSYVLNNPLAYNDPTGHWPNWSGIGRSVWSGMKNTAQNVWNGLQVGYNEAISFCQNPVSYTVEKALSIEPISNVAGIEYVTHYSDSIKGIDSVPVYHYGNQGIVPSVLKNVNGVSLNPIGTFVKESALTSDPTIPAHEAYHYDEQSDWGMGLWLTAYYGEMIVDWAHYGGDYWKGPYNMNSREVAARNYSGQPSHPYSIPTPWWEPLYNTYIQNTNNKYSGDTLWQYLGW